MVPRPVTPEVGVGREEHLGTLSKMIQSSVVDQLSSTLRGTESLTEFSMIFFDDLFGTCDCRSFNWASEPNAVMKQEYDPHRQAGCSESPKKFQHGDLEYIRLQHLDNSILGLSFLPLAKSTLRVETAPAAIKRFHSSMACEAA